MSNDDQTDRKPAPKNAKPPADGTASRNATYRAVYRSTGSHRAACAAYCAGNKWLTENARAVGNID